VLALGAATVVLLVGASPWIALGVAVVTGLIPLIPIGRRVLLDWIATWWNYRAHREYRIGDSDDFRGPDDRSLGLYWDESRVVAVVEVLPPPGGLTRIDRTAVHASHLLPMAELATCLAQHDILL